MSHVQYLYRVASSLVLMEPPLNEDKSSDNLIDGLCDDFGDNLAWELATVDDINQPINASVRAHSPCSPCVLYFTSFTSLYFVCVQCKGTYLHEYSSKGKLALVKLVLEAGANIEIRDQVSRLTLSAHDWAISPCDVVYLQVVWRHGTSRSSVQGALECGEAVA